MTIPTDQEPLPVPVPIPEVTGDDRLWVVLCFLLTPIFPLITLFMDSKKDRPFIKYHTVPTLIFGVVEGIVVAVLSWIPVVQCIVPFIWIINVIYALKANKGVKVDIPVITQFAKDQNWM
jgi:uncharacterized membrane protein